MSGTKERNECKVVEYQLADTEQVVDIIDQLLKELEVIPNTEEKIDDEDLFKIPEVYSGRGRFWVAKAGEKIVGTVAIREMGKETVKLNRMFVRSDYHGTGIGQALFNQALEFAKEQGYEKIILNTHTKMERAHRFYEKNGFKRVGEELEKYHYEMEIN